MSGNASCHLGVEGEDEKVGQIEILNPQAPEKIEIYLTEKNETFEAGEKIVAECVASNGRFTKNLEWFLADESLGSGDIEVVTKIDENSSTATVQSTLKYFLKSKDHGKVLECRATHPGALNSTSSAEKTLSVGFRPVPQPEIEFPDIKIGNSGVIGPITVEANPQPTFQWFVDGENLEEFYDRFIEIQPKPAGSNLWELSLFVGEFTSKDKKRNIELVAENKYGSTCYVVKVGPKLTSEKSTEVFFF